MAAVTIRLFASHPVAAAQYKKVLTAEEDFLLVSDNTSPRVGVFDSEPATEAILTLARLRFTSMRPLLLSHPCDENECLRWLFRGICGVVAYDRYEEELPQAVREVAEEELWFPAAVVTRWMRIDVTTRTSALQLPLTQREREVFEYLLRRFSNKEIADILKISERTVKFHVANVLNKLQVTSRHELAARWVPHLRLT